MQSENRTSLLYLWKKRSFFIGSLEESLNISTGASTIMFALEKDILVRNSQVEFSCRSLLVPAGEAINIDSQGGIIANCTLEPTGLDFYLLKSKMKQNRDHLLFNHSEHDLLLSKLIDLQKPPITEHEVETFLSSYLFKDPSIDSPYRNTTPTVDPRIKTILKYIEDNPCDNTSLSDLAKMVHISESYLTELFKQTTGLPIRRYRLWCRVYHTVASTCLGQSLTQSAINMGFNDSPHFNRTFRSMLGIAPSTVFSQPNGLTVLPPNIS